MRNDPSLPVTVSEWMDGLSIIYFGNDWFAENRTSSHHIARRLGRRFPLLYVEVPGLRAPQVTGRDARKLCKKLVNCLCPPTSIGQHMWHMTLPQLPFRRWPLIGTLNRLVGLMLLRRAMRCLRLRRKISWFLVPHPGALAKRLGELLTIYYCVDNYAALPDVDPVEVARMDEELTQRADLVFVVSPALEQAKRARHPAVFFSPHGVDVDLFATAADRSIPVAEGAAGLLGPVVGFFGVLDDRFDVSLLEYLAATRPDWSFLLVGRIATDVSGMKKLRNVHMPGGVPYESLPDWARAFDVCLMPYKQDAFSQNANPLKMREYLAMGKPVVSVPNPEVERFGDLVTIAHDRAQFLAAIETSLAEDSPELHRRRRELVAPMTWDARVSELIRVVQETLAARRGLGAFVPSA